MAFRVPDSLAGSGGLTVEGDIEIDAFDNVARIVSLPDTVPLPAASLPEMPAGTIIANITVADDVPTFHPLATLAGSGISYTNVTGVFDLNGSTSIVVTGDQITRAALVGDITAAANVNTTAFRTFAAKSVLVNATNASAVPSDLAGSGAFQYLRVNSANTDLEWATLSSHASTSIIYSSNTFERAALSGAISAAQNSNATLFAGILVDGVATTNRTNINFISGSNVTLTPTDDAGNDEIEITIAASGGGGLTPISDQRVLGNDSGVAATPTATTVHQVLDWIGGEEQWLFDGSNDLVDFGDVHAFERTDAFTLSVWTNSSFYFGKALPTSINTNQRGYSFSLSSGGNIAVRLNSNISTSAAIVLNSTSTVTVTERTHFVITYDGSSNASGVTVYLNGSTVTMTTVGASVAATIVSAAHLCLGGKEDGVGVAAGIQQHAALWDSELTSGEVLEVYDSGVPPDLNALPTAPAPIFWAKMDEDDATGAGGIIDHGSGGNDGTAQNGLAPVGAIGNLPVRGSTTWQLVAPGASGIALISNGTSALPSFRQIGLNGLPSMAAGSVLANVTAGSAAPTAHDLATFAGAGLTYTNVTGILAVGSSTSITVNANDVQRAALTGAITASANSNTTAFGTLAAKSVLANATNATAVPAALAGSAAFQHLRVNSANTALEWSVLTLAAFPTMAAGSFLANVTAGTAVPTAHDLATLAGAGLTYTNVTGIMAVGAGSGITVNANDVAITAGGVTPAMVQVITSSTAIGITIYASFTAGAGGAADDVSIFTSNAPFNFRILEVIVYTATAVALSTVTLRSATGGGGSALSSAISTTIAGQTSNNNTATTTVASASSLVIRRSDSGIAGEVVIFAVKT